MCGLVGIIDRIIDPNQINMFRWMVHFDLVRGEDSTGVAIRSEEHKPGTGRVDIYKALGAPQNLYNKYPETFEPNGKVRNNQPGNIRFLMGHNRAKTIGGASPTNAHPFHVGHIVGCHNGTINTGLHKLPDAVEGETDSEQIFRALAEGMTIDEIVDALHGAKALTWWDSKKKTFNLFRNKERPLYLGKNAAGNSIAYASEEWMLKVAANKARCASTITIFEEVPVDTHIVIQIDPVVKIIETREVKKKVFTGTPPTVVGGSQHTTHNYGPNSRNPNFGKAKNAGKEIVSDTGWYTPKFHGEADFNKSVKFGCSLCQTNLFFADQEVGDVRWLDRDTPLCNECSTTFNEDQKEA